MLVLSLFTLLLQKDGEYPQPDEKNGMLCRLGPCIFYNGWGKTFSHLLGAKGYLKFSIHVTGPGDEPPPSPSTISQEDDDTEE